MEQKWFEMADVRKRRFDSAVWIPLRANHKQETGKWGCLGHKSDTFGVASLAVPLRKRKAAENLGWRDLNLTHDHCGFAYRGRYIPADEYDDPNLKGAVPLVMSQSGNSAEPPTWHIHPDFVITLDLKREANVWVAMNEDYVEVVRLKAGQGQQPNPARGTRRAPEGLPLRKTHGVAHLMVPRATRGCRSKAGLQLA